MLKTITTFVYMLYCLIKYTPAMLRLNKKRNKGLPYRLEVGEIAAGWARKFIAFTGATVTVQGGDKIPEGPVCFICNHQSIFDIPLLLGYIKKPKGFISKIEIRKIPLLSDWMQLMGCVFMDRKDMRQSVNAIKEGSKNMKNGQSMVIFPEGTRSKDGQVNNFKAGSFKMALNAKVPIVPVTLDGARDLFEANKNRVKPSGVRIIVHDPVDTVKLNKEEISDIHKRVQATISSQITKI